MDNSTQNSEIDDIIQELRDGAAEVPASKPKNIDIPRIDDDNVGDYIYQKSAEMIELSMAAIRDMQNIIQTASDPKEVSAYSQLLGTAFKGIDNLNKIFLQQKQAKNNIEVKKIEASIKSKNPNVPVLPVGTQNNIFVGSPDEARKMLMGDKPKKIELESNEVIEGNFEDS